MTDTHTDTFDLPSWGSRERQNSVNPYPVTPDEINSSGAITAGREAEIAARARSLIQARDNYIPEKVHQHEFTRKQY